MYKPKKLTPDIAYRRVVKNCLALMGYTEQEIHELRNRGVQEAEEIWLGVQAIAEERSNLYARRQ
jgi:hypothetical protein